jgi:hypothetical protein
MANVFSILWMTESSVRKGAPNQRKKRKGAFWEDRYHATAVESNEHLIQRLVYLVYIDLNMVRAAACGKSSIRVE